MSYLVLARKWRPRTFEEIVGQDHITTILKNSIRLKRIGHAYLFSGPKGVGKTTTARIFSKALNCIKGPTPEPCLACTNCKEIAEGLNLDVLEIDGASNRGIDQVRDLRESAKLSPVASHFKIYIIDEVHMLTLEAFNALLKILEEPPAHVKFIFATTQPYRLPATIISRCQRFDFRKIPLSLIISRLQEICRVENIPYEPEALFTIAKMAEGSLRDAQSILDQVICLNEKKITNDSVINLLGIIPAHAIFSVVDSILEKDCSSSLLAINELIANGIDPYQLSHELLHYFRNIFLVKIIAQADSVINISQEEFANLKTKSAKLEEEELIFIIQTLALFQDRIRHSFSPRIMLELAVIYCCERAKYRKVGEAIKALEELKKEVIAKKEGKLHLEKTISKLQDQEKNDDTESLDDKELLLERLKSIWPQIINQIKGKKISLASCLEEAKIVSLEEDLVTLSLNNDSNFHSQMLEDRENKMLVEEILSNYLKKPLKVRYLKKTRDNYLTSNTKKQTLNQILNDPLVRMIEKAFDAKISRIIPKGKNEGAS